MTTLAISAANFAASTVTQTATQFALSAANSAISNIFDNRTYEGPRLESFELQTSQDGAPMPKVYGRMRLAGQVIWASRLREIQTEEDVSTGKGGGPTQTQYRYYISFAIGLCEGEILGIDRLWANGSPLQEQGLTMRVYKGTEGQLPDPIIQAVEGNAVPAFRNTAYIVFEDFPLEGFGARLPQINAEVIRIPPSIDAKAPDKMEQLIKSVNLLPATGEFAYATDIVEETPEPGVSRPINMNNLSGQADIMLALDQLEDQLPNCQHVSIITAWFGTALACKDCEIHPGVERRDRILPYHSWTVAGETRGTAYLVSMDAEGRPNFGGTPSDESIKQTIIELKRRGYKVTLYPFLLMDIPSGTNPFPWRGRISGDEGASAVSQVATFFNRDKGFKNYILHYAQLAQNVGGVDAFVIGSEMRGLTTLRGPRINGVSTYPAVPHFVALAQDVKAVLGPSCAVTYAADWSEYFGHHPQDGSGDVNFHLDPLWASSAIDVIGIDGYFPLSDWRDGPHLDTDLAPDIYDKAYLQSQIEGGEGYDYFYDSDADRQAQNRTEVTDGTANKPWVFRYKDLRNWWSNTHYNRVNGVETGAPTRWQPQSKPICFLEIGCPAVRFGANQPNLFYDSKSGESARPHFSDGSRDDLMQRRYIEAFISYWDNPENNLLSSDYSGRMIQTDQMSVWAWDARPFPDFPARESVWADGEAWQSGHWISGRIGLVPIADIVRELAAQSGLMSIDTSQLNGVVQGFKIDRPMSARAALSTLSQIYSFSLAEQGGVVSFFSLGQGDVSAIPLSAITENIKGVVRHIHSDPAEALRDVRLHFIDAGADYQNGLASSQDRASETENILDIAAPLVLDRYFAGYLCDNLFERLEKQNEELHLSLSPRALEIEVGDRVTLPDIVGIWRIETIEESDVRKIIAVPDGAAPLSLVNGAIPETSTNIVWPSRPVPLALDLPAPYSGLGVGVVMHPFAPSRIVSGDSEVSTSQALHVGAVLSDIPAGPTAYFDRQATFEFELRGLTLSRHDEAAVLNGANRFAIETPMGWDIMQAASVTLIGVNRYRASILLRGVGSEGYSRDGVAAGARLVWLNAGVQVLDVSPELLGETIALTAEVAGRQSLPTNHIFKASHLRPLSPVHLRAVPNDTGLNISWIRRSREDADSWVGEIPLGEAEERYRLRLWSHNNLVQTTETTAPNYFTTVQGLTKIDVAQGSDAYGWGEITTIEF
ncbi:putative tail protein [Litorimonas taeanensis]|uniref:Putative tail protein n=1 Tax=Litorimonas taeanensis TaxID=568099 RepID=A0A420WJ15_9PROT|nr:glycoside hydrolase/phage tail family protein [Litorimonas taeanensis]RKQ70915.1 putative tail protein [Litorimonas taeanensis]